MKRAIDVVVSGVGLLLSSPVIGLAALAVWLQDFKNPIYVSLRVRNQRATFRMYKFRSMVPNADRMGGTSTSADDRRLTPAGRVIRLFKIDELPQLWNVLIGDMSLVGPRPQVVQDAIKYTAQENHLFDVRPGITDFASITFADEANILEGAPDADARYNELIRPWKSRLGLFYVNRNSVSVDVQVIGLTVLAILSRKAALSRLQRLLQNLGAEEQLVTVAGREAALVAALPPGGAVGAADNGPYLPESVFVRAHWLQTLNRIRRVPIALLQIGVMVISNYAAWFLRYDGVLTPDRLAIMWPAMAWLVGIRTLVFVPFRLFEGLWLYTGVYDIKTLFAGIVVSSLTFWMWVRIALPPATYPYSVAVVDAMALFILLGGIRMSRRLLAELSPSGGQGKRVLIYGAGRAGEMAVREMRQQRPAAFRAIGFIDDNMRKLGLRIHGVPVLGTYRDLASILSNLHPDQLLIASDLTAVDQADLNRVAASFGVTVRRGDTTANQPRPVVHVKSPDPSDLTRAEVCPKCGSGAMHRSKTRNAYERAYRALSPRRIFRCGRCGWRGWLHPIDAPGSLPGAEQAENPDLSALDDVLLIKKEHSSERPPITGLDRHESTSSRLRN